MDFLEWLEQLPLSQWVAQSEAGYPSMLSIHSIGMSVVVGLLMMLDVRVLGLGRQIPIMAFKRFMPFAWAGFILNLITGILLFNSTSHRFLVNWPFLSKMGCIVAAGAVTWLLWRELEKAEQVSADGVVAISGTAKLLATTSIILWLLAITFGRLIAYIMDYMILNGRT